jgi:hypothetical protein
LILQLDDPAGRTGLVEHLFQEHRHSPLTLFEAAHEQGSQGHQPRSGLALGNAGGQLAAGAFPAARADQPMQLVFRHQRLDFRNLPDLVPQRLRVDARQRFATSAAIVGHAGDDLLTRLPVSG